MERSTHRRHPPRRQGARCPHRNASATHWGPDDAYALGLSHGTWRGHRHISHSGSTAGYQTYLTRFTDDSVSIAVFCNTADANPGQAALRIAALLLPDRTAAAASRPAVDTAAIRAVVGRYRHPASDELADFLFRNDGLGIRTSAASGLAAPTGARSFRAENGATFEFLGAGPERQVRVTDGDGVSRTYVEVVAPDAATLRLADYAGTYESPELGVRYEVHVAANQLVVRFPPQPDERLVPLYLDGFVAGGRTVRFVRDGSGRIGELQVFAGRVRGVRFLRVGNG